MGRDDRVNTPYAYYIGPSYIAGYRGYTLIELGRHDEAQETLRALTSPTGEAPTYPRRRARRLLQLAESYAMGRDVPAACRSAGDVVDLLRAVSSGWVARRLRRLHDQLLLAARGGDIARVRELGDRLRGVA